MKELRTEIEIDAPVENVWRALTDFPAFPEWNPFIRRIQGTPAVGSRLEVTLGASGTKPMTFRPTVKGFVPNQELRWLGRVGIPGLFDGEHIFELSPVGPDRTRFVQRENFRGLFVPFLAKSLDRDARRGFEEMNQALRARVTGTGEVPRRA
ncbi:MAG: SRPBCC domain-containing protein [Methanobacteriota archaeon]|nr:MAG: SRPBCC domain-containing protein [Euryarchaeota archaeon]